MYLHAVFLIAISGLTVNALTINLQGKITNHSGTGVPNAIVTLLQQGLKDTTGTDGTFLINGQTTNTLSSIPSHKGLSVNNGYLEFRLTHNSSIKVEIFNAKGSLLEKMASKDVSEGIYRLNIEKYCKSANLLIIHVSIGSRELSFTYLPLKSGANTLISTCKKSNSAPGKLTKIAAIRDTLRIVASGYIAQTKAIFSYDTVVNIILDTNCTKKIDGNWRLVGGTASIEDSVVGHFTLLLCPTFYCFSDNRLTKYESSQMVQCKKNKSNKETCDTTIFCYDTIKYDFTATNDSTYQCWGDSITITFKSDTLVFNRMYVHLPQNCKNTMYLVKETQPVPYCSRECVKKQQ